MNTVVSSLPPPETLTSEFNECLPPILGYQQETLCGVSIILLFPQTPAFP